MTADYVTILRCKPSIAATKRWTLGQDGAPVCESYGRARRWLATRRRVADVEQLAVLLDELSADPRAVVIRGEPLPGVLGTWGRRLEHRDPETGEEPRFVGVPRRWVGLDFDSVATIERFDLRQRGDVREAIAYLRGMLSAPFRRAACYGTLTASAGFGDPLRISARLWFWLARPVDGAELKAWARETGAPIDVSLFRAVQPHYVAAPLFEGMEDPIPQRGVMLSGSPEVALPRYETPAPALPREPYKARPRDHGDGDRHGRRYALATLERLAAELAGAGEGERHATVHYAARRAGGLVPGGWLTQREIAEELTAAARAAGLTGNREAEVARTIRDGITCGAERWPWDPPARAA